MTNEERAWKIKELMFKRGRMTAIELEEKSGVHRNTISNALAGKNLTVASLHSIAKGLGVDAKELI